MSEPGVNLIRNEAGVRVQIGKTVLDEADSAVFIQWVQGEAEPLMRSAAQLAVAIAGGAPKSDVSGASE